MSNNQSRYAFTHHNLSAKGQWLQWLLKTTISEFLFWVHRQILKRYDANAYVFDDYRLKEIRRFVNEYCSENMEQRKQDIINTGMDIFLFLLKEDVFYRARFFDMMQKWNRVQGLTGIEQLNLEEWKGK